MATKRDKVNRIKSQRGCADCGITDYRVLEFDHLPQFKKVANVSDLVRANKSYDVILREIRKCDVVCANCHRLRTVYRRY